MANVQHQTRNWSWFLIIGRSFIAHLEINPRRTVCVAFQRFLRVFFKPPNCKPQKTSIKWDFQEDGQKYICNRVIHFRNHLMIVVTESVCCASSKLIICQICSSHFFSIIYDSIREFQIFWGWMESHFICPFFWILDVPKMQYLIKI